MPFFAKVQCTLLLPGVVRTIWARELMALALSHQSAEVPPPPHQEVQTCLPYRSWLSYADVVVSFISSEATESES
ncbi:hypothetical protein RND71_015724 [Anisodus tanguticus]|uniref:Secreted protein n=1 Tax=Anisodus tanguticus TaxID=243964 RepID=A0AAE1S6R8_9SOLA|nr:hypothetical protein RND71_015724 [Anisodus tanguticus]